MTSPLGLESNVVRLADYDPRWAELFAAEAERLRVVVTPLSIPLEHMGSTAIPGLRAKPILDILAGYDDPDRLQDYIAGLVAAGYVRDALRADPALQDAYAGIKRELASRNPATSEACIEGKAPFVRDVLGASL